MIKEVTKTYPVRKKVVTLSDSEPQQVALHVHDGQAKIRDMESQIVVPADDRLYTGTIEEMKELKTEIESKSQAKLEADQPDQINLNSAGREKLETLLKPDVAQAIIDRRPINNMDDLAEISGIGPATLRELQTKTTL